MYVPQYYLFIIVVVFSLVSIPGDEEEEEQFQLQRIFSKTFETSIRKITCCQTNDVACIDFHNYCDLINVSGLKENEYDACTYKLEKDEEALCFLPFKGKNMLNYFYELEGVAICKRTSIDILSFQGEKWTVQLVSHLSVASAYDDRIAVLQTNGDCFVITISENYVVNSFTVISSLPSIGYQSVIQWGDRNSMLIGYANENEKGLSLVMNLKEVGSFKPFNNPLYVISFLLIVSLLLILYIRITPLNNECIFTCFITNYFYYYTCRRVGNAALFQTLLFP